MDDRSPDTGVVRARPGRALACSSCRQKKLRCDRQQPCRSCMRSKDKRNVCSYATAPSLGPRPNIQTARLPDVTRPTPIIGIASSSAGERTIVGSTAGTAHPVPLHNLPLSQEQRGGQSWHTTDWDNVLTTNASDNISASDQLPQYFARGSENEDRTTERDSFSKLLGNPPNAIGAAMMKTRYISPSGWIYSVLLVPHLVAWLEKMNEEKGECFESFRTCKMLSKRLQTQQKLPWIHGEYGKFLPQKAIADLLLGNYFRTFGTVHRVLHVPSFQVKCDEAWKDKDTASVGFIVQLQLCLALGTLFYDDNFSLRPQAMQWIHEAGAWIETSSKRRLLFSTIQTMCLYMLGRESMQNTYGDRVWIHSGTVIRAAMVIGLHRDPKKLPHVTFAQGEMRRRLWMTVLEQTLGSCLDPGAAPMISLDDFDCGLPSNFDDSQLNLDSSEHLIPQNPDRVTDSSLQIALGRSLPVRLKIAKFCTQLNPDGYEMALKLNEEYVLACHSFSTSLRHMGSRLSEFQRQYCEMVMSRYTFALHIQYMVLVSQNSDYMLSRKACIDAALNLAYSSLPLTSYSGPLAAAVQAMQRSRAQGDDFVRLCITGSGPYRSAVFRAFMVIVAELMAIIEECKASFRWPTTVGTDADLLPGNIRACELLSLIRVAVEWTRRRTQTGQEANRDHLCTTLALASIEACIKDEPLKRALEVTGIAASSEERLILERLIGDCCDGNLSDAQLSSEDDGILGIDDIWFIEGADFGINY